MGIMKWNKKVSPERYLKQWPNGPAAKQAKKIVAMHEVASLTQEVPNHVGPVRFFSPRSNGLSVVVQPKEWYTQQTPSGSRTIQSEGKTAQFKNSIFVTEDPEIIEYLSHTYKDRRFPVVREELKTASVA